MKELNFPFKFKRKEINNFISVIIPVFQDASGLEETLKSLVLQSLDKNRYEIIVGNDGNNYLVNKICRDFKVICVPTARRVGSYSCRNKCLLQARGEYIAFIDAGTIADKDWLSRGCGTLKEYDYVGGPIVTIKHGKKISDRVFIYQKTVSFDVKDYMQNIGFAPTTNLFVKRVVLQKLGAFENKLFSSGDYEFGDRVRKSKIFSQYYDNRVVVFHPTRNFSELINKNKRLALGFIVLGKLYPERFPGMNNTIITAVLKSFFPPVWIFKKEKWNNIDLLTKFKVFFLAYFFCFYQHMVEAYIRIKILLVPERKIFID